MSLREKAEAAEPGPWTTGVSGNELRVKTEREGWRVCDLNHGPTAEFIAAADPPTVLALLDRAEKAEAELVHAERCWTDLGNDVLENAPDWFDGDEDQDGIAVRYVRWLEDRVAELERGDADRG